MRVGRDHFTAALAVLSSASTIAPAIAEGHHTAALHSSRSQAASLSGRTYSGQQINVVTSATGNESQVSGNSGNVTVNQTSGPVIVSAGWGYHLPSMKAPSGSGVESSSGGGLFNVGTSGAGGGAPVNIGTSGTGGGGLVNVGTGGTGGLVNIGTGGTSGGGLVNVGTGAASGGGLVNVGTSGNGGGGLVNVGTSGDRGGALVNVGTGNTSGAGLVNVGASSAEGGLVNLANEALRPTNGGGTPVELCGLCASALNGGVGGN